MRIASFLIVVLWSTLPSVAQFSYWSEIEESRIFLPAGSEAALSVQQSRTFALEPDALSEALKAAPLEFTEAASQKAAIIELPLPDGRLEAFEVVESPVMAPELAAKFPELRSYTARSISNPAVSGRFDLSPRGLHALLLTPEGQVLVEPYATNQNRYHLSYFARDIEIEASRRPPLSCGEDPMENLEKSDAEQQQLNRRHALSFRSSEPLELRTYRMALACTGEFAQNNGGTVASVMSTFNTSVNLLNAIYQNEFAIRFELVPDNDQLVFLDPATDPYENVSSGAGLLAQNIVAIGSNLEDFTAYDIGHVFNRSCDVGGVASLGSVCTENRARGVTCHYAGLTFMVTSVMAHEVGHQFRASHSWDNCPPSMGQRSSSNAFEPGSGSTIMSYQNLCGQSNNIPAPFGGYFNVGSMEDILLFARESVGSQCGEAVPTENHEPTISLDYENGFWIPISTPFELEGQAEDQDGDALTYCWEQYDLNVFGSPSELGAPVGNAPIFRSFPPREASNRVFPSIQKVISGNFDNTEVLPEYERDLTFRLTVRDNNPQGGAAVWEEMDFKADGQSGPFRVLTPLPEDTLPWRGGQYRKVKWDVANTTNGRVDCQYVDVLLSADGGFTYPYTLVEGTPNDGSAFVNVPNVATQDARLRVQASGNIFFAISEQDFSIEEAQEPGYAMRVSPVAVPLLCLPGEESVELQVDTDSWLGYDSLLQLDAVGELPLNASLSFAADTIAAGDATTATLQIPAQQLGRDTFNFQLRAIAPDGDTALREVRLITLTSDYSELELQEPPDGTKGVVFSTDFSWVDVPSADTYDFEVATQPDFSEDNLVERVVGLEEAFYEPETLFEEENRIYFWRVRPVNECGSGEFLPPHAFQTATFDCKESAPEDLPITLPNSPNTKRSRIFVTEDGTISDVNISDVTINFSPLNVLRVSIVSPAGTEVVLFNQTCFGSLLRATFDDEAPGFFDCLNTSLAPAKPVESLSAFNGESTFGEWVLKVRVVDFGNGGGAIQNWNMEFCASTNPAAPVLVANETLEVPPGQGNTITTNQLKAEDGISQASELEFKLLTVPAHGQLYRGGDPLEMGDEFTQLTVDAFNLTYEHDGDGSETDRFTFIVNNQEGGWLPTQTFNIVMDENAVVSTAEPDWTERLRLFPNPATESVSLDFGTAVNDDVLLELFNVQGQRFLSRRYKGGPQRVELGLRNLPAGMYWLRLYTEQESQSRKLIVK